MNFLTEEKLTIVGAAGMIGSNMVQTAIMMGLTPNICAYDPYAPALEGVAEEMFHCGFEGVNLTYTSDMAEALGGARPTVGGTREEALLDVGRRSVTIKGRDNKSGGDAHPGEGGDHPVGGAPAAA